MYVNIENLKKFLGSDEAFIALLMVKFIQECPKETARLKEFAGQNNWERTKAVSHKMLSSTKIFGLLEFTFILKQVEEFSETRTNLEKMEDLVYKVEIECKNVLAEMKQIRATLPK